LFNALKNNPSIIPILAYPSSVFFLLNQENFIRAVKEWLGYALESLLYHVGLIFLLSGCHIHKLQVSLLGNQKDCEKLYREIMQHLHIQNLPELEQEAQPNFANKALFAILTKTVQFKVNFDNAKIKAHDYHKVNFSKFLLFSTLKHLQMGKKIVSAPDSVPHGKCKNCYSEAPENQCIQEIFVEVQEVDSTFIGHGVSLVNKAEFMQAQVRSFFSS